MAQEQRPLAGDRPAYLQQPGESTQAWAAFVAYRDMGPRRTVPDAYRQEKGNPEASQPSGTWNRWATEWSWRERAQAFDAYEDEQLRLRRVELRKEAQERHIRRAQILQDRAMASLYGVEWDPVDEDGNPVVTRSGFGAPALKPEGLDNSRKALAEGIRLERQALGLAEVVRQEHTGADGGDITVRYVGLRIVKPEDPKPEEEE